MTPLAFVAGLLTVTSTLAIAQAATLTDLRWPILYFGSVVLPLVVFIVGRRRHPEVLAALPLMFTNPTVILMTGMMRPPVEGDPLLQWGGLGLSAVLVLVAVLVGRRPSFQR